MVEWSLHNSNLKNRAQAARTIRIVRNPYNAIKIDSNISENFEYITVASKIPSFLGIPWGLNQGQLGIQHGKPGIHQVASACKFGQLLGGTNLLVNPFMQT